MNSPQQLLEIWQSWRIEAKQKKSVDGPLKIAHQQIFMTHYKLADHILEELWRCYVQGGEWIAPQKQSIRDMDRLVSYYQQLIEQHAPALVMPMPIQDLYLFRRASFDSDAWQALTQNTEPLTQTKLHKKLEASLTRLAQTKHSILLEGSPGTGKSTLLVKILTAHKLQYRWLQGGQAGVREQLTQLFHQGSNGLLDELNVDCDESLLIGLFDGFDKEKNPAKNPGFRLFATQNSALAGGRKAISNALRNRFISFHMPGLTQEQMIHFAAKKHVNPAKLSDYLKSCANTQKPYNYRDLLGS